MDTTATNALIGSFCPTIDGDWSNLARATALTVRESLRKPGVWVVFAHHAGRASALAECESRSAADDHVRWLLHQLEGWEG